MNSDRAKMEISIVLYCICTVLYDRRELCLRIGLGTEAGWVGLGWDGMGCWPGDYLKQRNFPWAMRWEVPPIVPIPHPALHVILHRSVSVLRLYPSIHARYRHRALLRADSAVLGCQMTVLYRTVLHSTVRYTYPETDGEASEGCLVGHVAVQGWRPPRWKFQRVLGVLGRFWLRQRDGIARFQNATACAFSASACGPTEQRRHAVRS
jgi:hypothetical protein